MSTAQTGAAKRQPIVPPAAQAMYDHYHFAAATRVGDMIWVSGQVGIGPDMQPGKDMAAQARLATDRPQRDEAGA